jgi:transposase
MSNEKYIGLDVHQATISVAVMDCQGKVVMESILETKASTLLEFFAGLRGSLFVTFEEGTWAAWLYDLLKPHVTEVLVCNPRKIPLHKQGNKSDKIDARTRRAGCASMISSPCTTAKLGYACCASWPEVISPSSKIIPA